MVVSSKPCDPSAKAVAVLVVQPQGHKACTVSVHTQTQTDMGIMGSQVEDSVRVSPRFFSEGPEVHLPREAMGAGRASTSATDLSRRTGPVPFVPSKKPTG